MARSPPAPTPTPRSPAASIPTPKSPPPPTSTPRSWAEVATAVDPGVQKEAHDDDSGGFDVCKEEHDIGEVQAEHWRAVKVEKDAYPGHEEHRGIGKVEKEQQTASMGEEPRKSKKTRRKRQSDGEAIGMGHEPPKSQGRMEKFNAMIVQVGLACKNHPSLDVPTRWNSTYLMLESSLPFRVAFEALKETDKDYKFAPSASEWEMAEAICHLLGAFYSATNKISGRTYPTSHLYFYEVWNVKQVMEKEVSSENPTIVAMVKEMEKKWIKYFEESFLTSCLPVIFDPRYKYEYVDFRLTAAFGGGAEKYLTMVKNVMKILFAEYASEFGNTSDEGDELA